MKHFPIFIPACLIALGALAFLLRRWVRNTKESPEYKAHMELLRKSHIAEETVVEVAPWFGTTGLPDDVEREISKYLRREFGELLLEEGSFKASDLEYIGEFKEAHTDVHCWRIVRGEGSSAFATAWVSPEGSISIGWGCERPPGLGTDV